MRRQYPFFNPAPLEVLSEALMATASKNHGSRAVREPWMWKPFVNCKGLGQWRVVWS